MLHKQKKSPILNKVDILRQIWLYTTDRGNVWKLRTRYYRCTVLSKISKMQTGFRAGGEHNGIGGNYVDLSLFYNVLTFPGVGHLYNRWILICKSSFDNPRKINKHPPLIWSEHKRHILNIVTLLWFTILHPTSLFLLAYWNGSSLSLTNLLIHKCTDQYYDHFFTTLTHLNYSV